MKSSEIPGIAEMSPSEKILLVEDLWDDIIINETRIGIPDSHKNELNRRLANHNKNPGKLLSLKELQSRIEENLVIFGLFHCARNPQFIQDSLEKRRI
jgi:putative addiction module component (TIGR02574 family)